MTRSRARTTTREITERPVSAPGRRRRVTQDEDEELRSDLARHIGTPFLPHRTATGSSAR